MEFIEALITLHAEIAISVVAREIEATAHSYVGEVEQSADYVVALCAADIACEAVSAKYDTSRMVREVKTPASARVRPLADAALAILRAAEALRSGYTCADDVLREDKMVEEAKRDIRRAFDHLVRFAREWRGYTAPDLQVRMSDRIADALARQG